MNEFCPTQKDSICVLHEIQISKKAARHRKGAGRLNKSIELCEKALKEKKSPAEEFYALFYLSQFLFDKNQKEKAAVYLNKALEIEKDSEFIKNYIKINNDGYSFFTYNKNKSKLEGYYSE